MAQQIDILLTSMTSGWVKITNTGTTRATQDFLMQHDRFMDRVLFGEGPNVSSFAIKFDRVARFADCAERHGLVARYEGGARG